PHGKPSRKRNAHSDWLTSEQHCFGTLPKSMPNSQTSTQPSSRSPTGEGAKPSPLLRAEGGCTVRKEQELQTLMPELLTTAPVSLTPAAHDAVSWTTIVHAYCSHIRSVYREERTRIANFDDGVVDHSSGDGVQLPFWGQ